MESQLIYKIVHHPEQGYFRAYAIGKANMDNLQKMYLEVLQGLSEKKGINRLWDFSRIDLSTITLGDLDSFANYIRAAGLENDEVNSAILLRDNLRAAIIRKLKDVIKEVIAADIIITKSHDEAVAWVQKGNEQTQ